jgi:hypothetical protein
MAIDACLRGWNLRMGRFVHRCMTIFAVHFQLTRMERVAKRNGLQGSVACVQGLGTRYSQEQDTRITASGEDQDPEEGQELVGPSGEEKSLGHRSLATSNWDECGTIR